MKTRSVTREATCFWQPGGARKAAKNVWLERGTRALAVAAFLHNVIIVSSEL